MTRKRKKVDPTQLDIDRPRSRKYDVDSIGADGFAYEPDWTRGLPMNGLFGPSLARVNVCAPLGMDFQILLVLGWDRNGEPHLDITMSREIADSLAKNLEISRIVEIENAALWAPLHESAKPFKK